MKKRIKQLVAASSKPTLAPLFPALSPDLETDIMDDIATGKLLSYDDIANRLGCSREKARLDARGFPVIKAGKIHKVPESVFRLIVRRKLSAA
jgi:hypothetical protein